MGKKRIFEIAKEYGVKSPEVIELLALRLQKNMG